MPRKFNVPIDDLPELKVVQNFSNYFRKTKMMNNDFVDELAKYIRGLEYNGNEALKVHYMMGDAEEAQYNAIQSTLGSDNVLEVLICYYHVVANVMKRTKIMEPYFANKVVSDIYDMHFSRSAHECATLARARVAE
ncbi:hypothetical protein F443_10539 [Phytophthora nicotianae P1569]|uniref:MULE transposase domain-containing protein n=1 Tax=Phytophthora nicotianae P1569 TaxID=1317065 RepID=V9EZT4_PHYNI|nr:hypothetical protein F443_10539 [Phytophthora nicotianae P1569]